VVKPAALTVSGDGPLIDIKCPISVGTPRVEPSVPHDQLTGEVTAIWDTGAQGSVITQGIVDQLGISPVGMVMVHGVNGQEISPVYLVDFCLPNGVTMAGLAVTLGKLTGADALIGMDIVRAGDFSITNRGGKTKMSSRVPSQADTDFVVEINKANLRHNGRVTPKGARPKRGR
jgi:hypothetical protein